MHFSHYVKKATVLLAVLAIASFAAKASSGTVRSVIGEVTTQKNGTADWKKLRIDNKVHQGDFIRTLLESQAILSMPDGSTFSIEESSLVLMSEINSEDGVNQFTAEVKSGKIQFDVQRQNQQDSRVNFKTGTAVAAIRGTNGTFGLTRKGTPMGALGSGNMDFTLGQQSVSIKGGQAVFTIKDRLIVFDLKGAGDPKFLDQIDSLLSDSTVVEDSLENQIKGLDSLYGAVLANIKDSIHCEFTAIPDTIYDSSIQIKGKCSNGVIVQVGAERQEVPQNKEVEFSPNWVPSTVGEKKFPITCSLNNVSVTCGLLHTYYAGQKDSVKDTTTTDSSAALVPLSITTASPAVICDPAAVTIEGTFNSLDPTATLVVKLGKYTSKNLVPLSAGGKFFHTINISDKNENWNETKAYVEYNSQVFGSEKASIDLSINKSCKNVNTQRPTIELSHQDSLGCYVSLNIKNVDGEQVLFSSSVDGTPSNEISYNKDTFFKYKLTSGSHTYEFTVEDQASNKSYFRKKLGCYPPINARLEIVGGSREILRIPPPPQGISKIYREIRFKILNIPQGNTDYVKRITISQNGKTLAILTDTDFLSTSFDRQVELTWGKTSEIKVVAVMKNGKILTATKTYEFTK